MPYSSNAELPASVKNVLPEEAQSIFRNVVNSQLERGLSESRAFASAWSALSNQGWSKGPEGKYIKKEENVKKKLRFTAVEDGHVHTFFDTVSGKTSYNDGHEHTYELGSLMTDEANGHTHKMPPDTFTQVGNIEVVGKVEKVDDTKNQVFGWASISITKDGNLLEDLHGDVILPEDLEEMAYDFVLNVRKAGEMHDKIEGVGTLIESIVFTREKIAAMGLEAGSLPVGWWVGFKVEPDIFEKVKSGEYTMFSIGGTTNLEDIEF